MADMITGVLFDVTKGTAEVATIEKSLESYYKILNCDAIDIVSRQIGVGDDIREFDIICDDEALLKKGAIASAVSKDGNDVLFGNIFVVKYDGCGDETSLTQDDIDIVKQSTKELIVTPIDDFGIPHISTILVYE